ncbi:MAG: pilin N-terminal domain-containing protein [Clostridiales bacterium]|nr:pilin N-terminal domain-containing protein [Clostridiales bacterium]
MTRNEKETRLCFKLYAHALHRGDIVHSDAAYGTGGRNIRQYTDRLKGCLRNHRGTYRNSHREYKPEFSGIYIDATGKINIYAGDFYDNTATTTYGGAIGTGIATGTSTVHNAVIVGNSANKGDARGGGIWSCTIGIVNFEERSVTIGGNTANNRGAQVCIESTAKPIMPQKAIDGTPYDWYWDMAGQRYPGKVIPFANGVTPAEYDGSGITLTNANSVTASSIGNLKAQFPEGKVFIYNNTAVCGGGVGGNGRILFAADQVELPTPTPTPTPTSEPTPTPTPIPGENSLVIHKYGLEDLSLSGPKGSGEELDASQLPDSAIPLPGIGFNLYLIDIFSHEAPPDCVNFALDDPYHPTKLYSPAIDTEHAYALLFIASETTDSTGLAVFNGLSDGLYLIVEQQNEDIIGVSGPCIVPLPLYNTGNDTWLTTVHLYPKNEYPKEEQPHSAQIEILKVSANDPAHKLQGASFKLSLMGSGEEGTFLRKDTSGKILYPGDEGYTDAEDWELTTGTDGLALFDGIKAYMGIYPKVYLMYYIFETEAPGGYIKLAAPIEAAFTAHGSGESNVYAIHCTIENSSAAPYPHTGGRGTRITTILGIALLLLTVVFAFAFARRSRRASL